MRNFKKTYRQKQASKIIKSKAKNVMLFGGSRSGKTFMLVYAVIIRAIKVKSRHVILRQNFNHVKRSIWLDTLPKVLSLCFPDLHAHPNKSDFYYKLANGSEIWIGGMDDQKSVEKILGNEYSTIYFNECSQLDYSSIQIAKTRLAEKNKLLKKCFYDENPPTKSHWSYWLFEKGIDPLDEVPINNREDYVSLLMNPGDNLDNIDDEYLSMLEKMPEKERNRFLLGKYNDESNGQVYYAFKRDVHVKNLERKPGTVWIGMDFNVNPMSAVIGQLIDNKFHILDEVYLTNADTYKMCDELKRRGYGGLKIIPDSTGANRKTSGKSDFDILKDSGFTIESTYNPFVTDRVNNINRLFTADDIVLDHKCKKLINDLERVVWKDSKLDQSGANKMLTHVSDCLGYLCWKIKPINSAMAKINMIPR